MKGYYVKDKIEKKLTFPEPKVNPNAYKQPIGPVRPTTKDRVVGAITGVLGHPQVSGAVNWVKERSRQVADEMNESPRQERREHYQPAPRRRGRKASQPRQIEYRDSPSPMMPPDPFGMGLMGMRDEPEQYQPAPRRRRRKASQPRQSEYSLMEPGYIPPSMRHLF